MHFSETYRSYSLPGVRDTNDIFKVMTVASPAMGHWGTCPSLDFKSFIFTVLHGMR